MKVFTFIQTTVQATSNNAFLLSGCTCVGYPLLFECTAVGPGATIWKGGAFNCLQSANEIRLLHSQFLQGTVNSCNNGQIVGLTAGVPETLHFHSHLTVDVSSEMNGTTVECEYDDGSTIHPLQNMEIITTTGINSRVIRRWFRIK